MVLLTVVRMIPAGVVPSRSFFSLSHRLVGRRWKKKERKMILISSLNSVSVCLLLWVFSTCLFTLDRIGPVYFRCVCFSCCYFLRLHETFDAPIIGLTCVCVCVFFLLLHIISDLLWYPMRLDCACARSAFVATQQNAAVDMSNSFPPSNRQTHT